MSAIAPHYRNVQQLLQSQSFSIGEYRSAACRTEGPFWVKPWLKPSIKIQQRRLDHTRQIAATCGSHHHGM